MSGNSDISPAFGGGRFHKWLPVIDEDICTGCNLCVEACGPQCLGIVDEIAVLLSANACGSEEHCIAVCRDDAIHMQWLPMGKDTNIGKWRIVVQKFGT